ncbi:hypothetical protein CFK37_00715 [Virgibacillus phasianinus]|uniref:DUF418 domain-containing protein n=1 Tax=Virgibacillus phasianinus TaxID=2017483 RepID=A0A220TYL1_9BACI|nr:DUF418 domain-containing protein [Virgibacillus phasianinus]ASK60830.1 hypothetical protein CFK37_00715 [Virgibacillus phasianinus]
MQAGPIKENKRLVWIDAARGFAIFGIFMVNVGAFSAPYFIHGGEAEAWTGALNHFVQGIIDVFFQASFYTLFSLLFGFGFQMMIDRLREKGSAVYSVLFRRMLILIGFGMIHAFLIWYGDILLSYGIIGLVLLLFINVKNKTLLVWAVFLMGVCVTYYTMFLYAYRDYLGFVDHGAIEQAIISYQSNSLGDIWSQNYVDWVYANGGISYIFLTGTLLPLFLVGMFIARKRWLHDLDRYDRVLKWGWMISLVLFLVLKLGPYAYGNPIWFSFAQDNIGGPVSALFYIFSIALLARSGTGMKVIKPFVTVGRMSLTNYLTQSIVMFILFYGVGFSLYGTVSPLEGVLVVVIIYLGQIVASRWWFSHYRFGPLEWVWRCLTYMKQQPFRKKEIDKENLHE